MKRKIKVKLEFEPRDLWVGVYWKFHRLGTIKRLDLYVCILPMLPIHIYYHEIRLLRFTGKKGQKVYSQDDPRLEFQSKEIEAVSYLADAATAALEPQSEE